jgi:glycerophosphoryl diester phosphodiesterase
VKSADEAVAAVVSVAAVVVAPAAVVVDSPAGADDVLAPDVVLSSLVEVSPLAPVDVAVAVTVSAATAAAPIIVSHLARESIGSDLLDVMELLQSVSAPRRGRTLPPYPQHWPPTLAVVHTGLAQSAIVQQRLPSLLDPPIGFAHRGARDRAPENTIEAFQVALQLGASGLESDVWLTADGVAVLDHDGVVRIGRRRRSIADCPAADLPEHIPTLRQLLEACGTGYHLSLDLKAAGTGEAVIDVVASAANDLLDRLWLCAATVEELVALRLVNSQVRLVHSTRLSRFAAGPERAAAVLAEEGIDSVNLHYTDWNGGLVALFHRFERIAFGWDLQYDHVIQPAVRMGLDGVYSDHVELMMEILAAEYMSPESLDYHRDLR